MSSFSDSNNWDSHSPQLSPLAHSPVLTPYQYSLLNLPSGGPASLSASGGPRRFSGLCCAGVCCVPLDSEVRLPSARKLPGPTPGSAGPPERPHKGPVVQYEPLRAPHWQLLLAAQPFRCVLGAFPSLACISPFFHFVEKIVQLESLLPTVEAQENF